MLQLREKNSSFLVIYVKTEPQLNYPTVSNLNLHSGVKFSKHAVNHVFLKVLSAFEMFSHLHSMKLLFCHSALLCECL